MFYSSQLNVKSNTKCTHKKTKKRENFRFAKRKIELEKKEMLAIRVLYKNTLYTMLAIGQINDVST